MHPASAETSCGFGAEGGVSGTATIVALSAAADGDFFRGDKLLVYQAGMLEEPAEKAVLREEHRTQRLKPDIFWRVAVCLKVYPDTNRQFLNSL